MDKTTSNTLTCVYCGKAYPEGTLPHGSKVLTDHIAVCKKHPLRAAEMKIKKLHAALAGLVGAESKEELDAMDVTLRAMPIPEADRVVSLNAVHALLETAE